MAEPKTEGNPDIPKKPTPQVKRRKITKGDHDAVVSQIMSELQERKSLSFRKEHEHIWREVDRQVAMQPKDAAPHDGKRSDWHNAVELGLLADALEIISADVLRIAMPQDRGWCQAHIEMPFKLDDNGDPLPSDKVVQEKKDGVLCALMTQQHADTGLRDRIKLSVKEALKHGGFVAEVRWENYPKFFAGGQTQNLGSPVWTPHSMWNCYPDPSPTVIGTNLFYNGSMIIETEMKWSTVLRMPWMNMAEIEKKKKRGSKGAKIIKYYGDLSFARSNGDIFVPNQQIIICEGQMASIKPYELPNSPIIYAGVEKDDVRDPYFTSPLIKRSPNHQAATHNLNKYLDAVDLVTEPPIAYNSLDPRFASDGPMIFPGAKIPTRGKAEVKVIYQVDPNHALQGYLTNKQIVEQGTGVDSVRAGMSESTEQTAEEVLKKDMRSEVRTVDFVSVIERQALKPYLYMHHELNKLHLGEYPFYCTVPNTPNFIRLSKKDLVKNAKAVHFEIVGSKGVLGEERRRQGVMGVTSALLAVPGGDTLVGRKGLANIAADAYGDFGVKDPYRYLTGAPRADDEVPMVPEEMLQQLQQQAQEMIDEAQKVARQLQEQNFKLVGENERVKVDKNAREEEIKLMEEQIQLLRTGFEQKQELQNKEIKIAKDAVNSKLAQQEVKHMGDKLEVAKEIFETNAEQRAATLAGDANGLQQRENNVTSIEAFIREQTERQAENDRQKQIILEQISKEGEIGASLAASLKAGEDE